jgi:hypothetical protein
MRPGGAARDRSAGVESDVRQSEDIARERWAVPSVAELPTRQNTLPPCAPLISETVEALAVVSVLPMLKMKTELGLFKPLSVRPPVN